MLLLGCVKLDYTVKDINFIRKNKVLQKWRSLNVGHRGLNVKMACHITLAVGRLTNITTHLKGPRAE